MLTHILTRVLCISLLCMRDWLNSFPIRDDNDGYDYDDDDDDDTKGVLYEHLY